MDKKQIKLKGRAVGATATTTALAQAQRALEAELGALASPAEVEAPPPRVPTLPELHAQLARLKHLHECARIRKERQEDLMQRRVARTWDHAKKARSVRRLMTAKTELEQSTELINQVIDLIATMSAQLAPPPARIVAPFVPSPATSVPEPQ